MNKNGFLLAEETLKLIISVIAIGFLAYFLFSLYQANKDSNDLDLAKESIEFLTSAVSSGETKVDIYNPNGWWLGTWTKLQKCSNIGLESCICICKEKNADSCDEDGICLDNGGFLIGVNPIEIKDPPITLNINYETKKISEEQ